jgi:hypothetical protein
VRHKRQTVSNDVWRQRALFGHFRQRVQNLVGLYTRSRCKALRCLGSTVDPCPNYRILMRHASAPLASAGHGGVLCYVWLSAWLATAFDAQTASSWHCIPCHGVTCASVKRNTTSPGAGSHREDSGAGAPARVSMHATTLHCGMHVISSAYEGTVAGAGSHRIEY